MRTNLFIPSRFWTTYTNFNTYLLSALYSDVRKKIIHVQSTFLSLDYRCGIHFKSLSYLYEVVRTFFPADFWTFRNF